MLTDNTKTAAELAAERWQRLVPPPAPVPPVQPVQKPQRKAKKLEEVLLDDTKYLTISEFEMFKADVLRQLKDIRKELWRLSKPMSPVEPVEAVTPDPSTLTALASASVAMGSSQQMTTKTPSSSLPKGKT
jgi:hypothetical protein